MVGRAIFDVHNEKSANRFSDRLEGSQTRFSNHFGFLILNTQILVVRPVGLSNRTGLPTGSVG